MPENKPEQEPSIEEILASIRQIISDDDAEPSAVAPAPLAPVEPVAAAPAPARQAPPPAFNIPEKKVDDVLELTDIVEDQPAAPEPVFEEEAPAVHVAPPPPPPPQPVASKRVQIDMKESEADGFSGVAASAPEVPMESIITEAAASATLEAFTKLATRAPLDRSGTGSVTIEDIVREMLRPLLREWIDRNLPAIVEKSVQKELDRLASKVDV